ncbi:hypothetical protein AUJ95_03650 [Candidatus Desantisbacteria bacterium CG2_30_40_21]|uniref:Uncharacterized protein n=5 Tax=unclassified Candidatus Desantisiibacteriota TaxID=3106372 RepID=A0A2M7JAP1_9BACT|nr:MAG: hypothetical protein AUJ95_03650 [Candidatus Desantisbacteria bacterium CG2_30_40_21]PIP39752.1 MAG: hypothetical protein COX18_09025 [Candidatus Desantisbacteria bacterium CG23_combo_of_CG06-09_8_20_14_all_40_23]PIX16458.1 MAG: hypothetical protein COZ71_07585 [Candidatus Desantisbacteria bacterium CG_4_8_14_3_um_filter_40_12]PIY18948.1 MAG: hypothetical protein COZ13_07920 [Candidatus Desantisbacteria bacterium CG_4_10_14_3_um_filter_40_18]PJB28908.1 MAG: hypothetical protein CO110_08
MKILPLHSALERYLQKHRLTRRWQKQLQLFEQNWRHTGLRTEMLEPKELRIYSFRVDLQYRAVFVFADKETVEIIDINNHYE